MLRCVEALEPFAERARQDREPARHRSAPGRREQESMAAHKEEIGMEMVDFKPMVYLPEKDTYMAVDEVPALTLYQEDALYGKRKGVTFTGRADARMPAFDMRIAD